MNYENLEVGEILAKLIKVPNIIYKYLDLLRSLLFSQIAVFFVLVVAAAEVVVGLAIIVSIFKKQESASVDMLSSSKG